jgi:hypothetical protein
MITRSKARAMVMHIDIDFDAASEAWMKNKKRIGQGYVYICGALCKNGKTCQKRVSITVYCSTHTVSCPSNMQ